MISVPETMVYSASNHENIGQTQHSFYIFFRDCLSILTLPSIRTIGIASNTPRAAYTGERRLLEAVSFARPSCDPRYRLPRGVPDTRKSNSASIHDQRRTQSDVSRPFLSRPTAIRVAQAAAIPLRFFCHTSIVPHTAANAPPATNRRNPNPTDLVVPSDEIPWYAHSPRQTCSPVP
jgi:hypothetical protein